MRTHWGDADGQIREIKEDKMEIKQNDVVRGINEKRLDCTKNNVQKYGRNYSQVTWRDSTQSNHESGHILQRVTPDYTHFYINIYKKTK